MQGINSTQPVSVMPVETMPTNIVKGSSGDLALFLFLNIWASHFALPLLVFLVLSRRVKRHATFANLMIVFIIVGFSSSLLLYAGKHTGPEPSGVLCLFQASLLYGVPAIATLAVFMLVLQMFLVIRDTVYGRTYKDSDHIMRSWVMVVTPYIAWLVSIVVTAAVGSANPASVSRSADFSTARTNTITTLAAIVLLVTVGLMIATVVLFYKRWVQIQQEGKTKALEYNLPVRILSFGLYLTIAMSLSLLSISTPQSPVPDLIIAFAATVVVLIFGTQRDIIRVLCFWKVRNPSETQSKGSTTPLKV